MSSSRRRMIGQLAAATAMAPAPSTVAQGVTMPAATAMPRPDARGPAEHGPLERAILDSFAGLPGRQALKIWAPAAEGHPDLLVQSNAAQQLFIGSAIKAFVLCARLRQLDGPDVLTALITRQLALDASVWSADSASVNPPNLIGSISERTAMEAMILHSDNTAADMELAQAGPEHVRAFLASAGLHQSAVPDSTRVFFGYLLGAKNYRSFSWADLQAAAHLPIVNSPLNRVQTLASSADDLVSFYERSMQGAFFGHAETLQQYRNVLRLGDVITFVLPLGVTAFAKGGSIHVPGFHALCVAGAMYFAGRWVYFATIINWDAPDETDPMTVQRYLAAAQGAFRLLYEGLGGR